LSKTKRAQQAQAVSATMIRRTAIAQAITFAFMAGTVQAQTAPTTPAADAQKIEAVTVTGIRRGIEAAISQKRNSDSIVEAISAEDIGKLPDASVAESISRLPGVASQRSGGRAQQISIRGLSSDFAGALLNGREQASTGDSRGVEFDQYPSELLGSVLIYKTPNGGLVGQGLSGTIDMRTVRPLAHVSNVLVLALMVTRVTVHV
jgi:iron complex outermembrane recepter protein